VADSIWLNPNGRLDFKGVAASIPHMKDLFDRLDVKWQIYYAGQFKSATEPLRLDKMSDPNRLQVRAYIGGIYDVMLEQISASRGIAVPELRRIADEYSANLPASATRLKMIDAVGYYDQFLVSLKTKLGLKETDKISSISLQDYTKSALEDRKTGSSKNKIAVVFAEGDIDYTGEDINTNGSIEGVRYARIIRKLRLDNKVKAIVLRVNSGGGSALASDLIWRELELAKQAGKPVIASFGDYAASGGYYIAAGADSIFAENNTLTGSIGVFLTIPSLNKTMRNKLGINFDSVRTSRYAGGFSTNFDLSEAESKILQGEADTIYERFLQVVAQGRHKTRDQIHEVAQGRVWIGSKAQELGLVDGIGGLDRAIQAAIQKAGLGTDYQVSEYPKTEGGIEKIIAEVFGGKPSNNPMSKVLVEQQLKAEMGSYYETFKFLKKSTQMRQPQMRLPYVLNVD
jgi:protease IV